MASCQIYNVSIPLSITQKNLLNRRLVDFINTYCLKKNLLTCRLVDLLTLFYNSFFEVFCEVDADLVAGVFDSHFCHVVVNHDFHEFLE